MRLLDLISQGRCALVRSEDGCELPCAGRYQGEVRECPLRYVLSDELVACSTQLVYAGGHCLSACLDLIHVPARSVWVEWADGPRQQALHETPALRRFCPSGARWAGALIRTGADCRSGHMSTFWSTPQDLAYVAPIVTAFDFDRSPDPTAGNGPGEWVAAVQVKQDPALNALLAHLRFRFDDDWAKYYANRCPTTADRSELLRRCLATCAFDAPMLMAFFLLLGARNLLPRREAHHERLNRIRRRGGKPALLAHIEVAAPLDLLPRVASPADSGVPRASRRLHHVRGHIVRRGTTIYWRTPHLRGSARLGQVRSRTVMLSFPPTHESAPGVPPSRRQTALR